MSNNNTPCGVWVDSDAGDQSPLLQAAIANWLAIIFCNCLFTTLVTRVGYLLLLYSPPIETNSGPYCLEPRTPSDAPLQEDLARRLQMPAEGI